MSDSCVEFSGIVKTYGQNTVIDDVSVSLPVDTTTAMVGESGSGKSTLLQLINGLVVPEKGSVRLFGELLDYADLPRIRRTMGYAVQGAGLFPHLTIEDNVTLVASLENWNVERIRERYRERGSFCARVGSDQARDQVIGLFSRPRPGRRQSLEKAYAGLDQPRGGL